MFWCGSGGTDLFYGGESSDGMLNRCTDVRVNVYVDCKKKNHTNY